MQIIKRNIWTFSIVALFTLLAFADGAMAQGTAVDLVGVAKGKASNVFYGVKTIIFVVGGFGLVAIAFFAIFGKVKWSWFAGLATGLAILAAAGAIVDYATGSGEGGGMGDSFQQIAPGSASNPGGGSY